MIQNQHAQTLGYYNLKTNQTIKVYGGLVGHSNSWPTLLTSNAKERLKADWASKSVGKTTYTFNQRRER